MERRSLQRSLELHGVLYQLVRRFCSRLRATRAIAKVGTTLREVSLALASSLRVQQNDSLGLPVHKYVRSLARKVDRTLFAVAGSASDLLTPARHRLVLAGRAYSKMDVENSAHRTAFTRTVSVTF